MPNPRTKEFPLRHKYGVHFSLQEFEATHLDDATMVPMITADQAKTEAIAQAVQVNPVSDTYEGIVISPNCFMNSRVNKIKISEYYTIPNASDVADLLYHKAVISVGLGDADVVDPSGGTILTQLRLQKNADTISANYTGTDLLNASFLPAECDGLTSTQELESIAHNPSNARNARNDTLGAKVRAMQMGPIPSRVHRDFPYVRSRWYDVPSRVKRMNAFCGCFLYLGLEEAVPVAGGSVINTWGSHFESELTTDEASLNCHLLFEFNEYNDSFDQTAG